MDTIKTMYKFRALYGDEIIIGELKTRYKTVAYTSKAIPAPGGPCKPSSEVAADVIIKRLIFHRNDEITAITQHGNLRFF